MDIGWAVKTMKNGEKVRRHVWAELTHVPEEASTLAIEKPAPGWADTLVITLNDGRQMAHTLSHNQILADDWELA